MKTFAAFTLGATLASAFALPHLEKRAMVTHTAWTEVVETVMTTTTVWVPAGGKVSAAAANPGGNLYETSRHFEHGGHHTKGKSPHKPSKPTPASKPKPAAYTPPAPATTAAAAPAPPAQSPAAPPPPAPTTTSTPPPPPPPTTAAKPTTQAPPPPAPTTPTYVAPAPTTSQAAAVQPASYSPPSSSSSGSSSSGGKTYSGDLTYYSAGLGSCGITSSDTDMIVAVAAPSMPYAANPNNNPWCGKKITIEANGVSTEATIVDTCPGCLGPQDLDCSPSLFQKFADLGAGRVHNMKWHFN